MEFKKVMVAGAGKSGIASAGLLIRNGIDVVLYDGNTELDKEALMSELRDSAKVEVALGELTDKMLEDIDLFVISPGIPYDAPFVEKVKDKGIPVWGEIELGYYYNRGCIAAITGGFNN